MSTTTRYLVLARRRPDFDVAVVAPHQAWLGELHARGLLESSGGFGDGSGGAYLLRGLDGLAAAQALVATDPLAITGSSDLSVHEWNLRDWSAA